MALNLVQAHAIMMILAWMFFGSTGVLFARYGRSLRLGNRRQCLGKAIWFQIHRFLLSITPLLVLLGFFFILVRAGGTWVDPQFSLLLFAHSILGGMIVCCVIIQIWLALYRCNPRSRFRYIFDWSHRIIGLSTLILFPCTVFLIVLSIPKARIILITIISLWTGWMVIVIILLENVEYQQRRAVVPVDAVREGTNRNNNNNNSDPQADIESGTNTVVFNRRLIIIRLVLFSLHIVISTTLSISFIVVFCS